MSDRCELNYPSGIKKRVAGDWNCPNCNNLNFAFRDYCNRCFSAKQDQTGFECFLYISPPTLDEQPSEFSESVPLRASMNDLPSVSPFFNDKFLKSPVPVKPVSSRLLFNKENQLDELLKTVKKPKTKKQGDWVCLKCKNLKFAFRNKCNQCNNQKVDYLNI